jgi:hypothetical protein
VLLRGSAKDLAVGTRVRVRAPERPQETGPGVGGAGAPQQESGAEGGVPRAPPQPTQR